MKTEKYSLFVFFLFFIPLCNFAQQKSSFAIEIDRPITIGETFYSNYDGIFGAEITYSYLIGKKFRANAAAGYSRYKLSNLEGIILDNPTYSNFLTGVLTVSYHYPITPNLFLAPEIGGGYGLLNFKNKQAGFHDNEGALILRAGLKITYDITRILSIGVAGHYNFINRHLKDVPDIKYNREVHVIHVGLILTRSF
jgi:hypothetical protein